MAVPASRSGASFLRRDPSSAAGTARRGLARLAVKSLATLATQRRMAQAWQHSATCLSAEPKRRRAHMSGFARQFSSADKKCHHSVSRRPHRCRVPIRLQGMLVGCTRKPAMPIATRPCDGLLSAELIDAFGVAQRQGRSAVAPGTGAVQRGQAIVATAEAAAKRTRDTFQRRDSVHLRPCRSYLADLIAKPYGIWVRACVGRAGSSHGQGTAASASDALHRQSLLSNPSCACPYLG